MVVDYVKGGELKAWIRKNRNKIDERHLRIVKITPFEQFLKYILYVIKNCQNLTLAKSRWMTQVASAMAYLEEKKIIHRDLAARNILLQKTQPKETHVLVSDFGLAKIVDSEQDFNRASDESVPYMW